MKHLSNYFDIILSILTDKPIKDISSISHQDWQQIIKISEYNYITPLIYYKLKRNNYLEQLPKTVISYLENRYQYNCAINLKTSYELYNFIDLLNDLNIPCIILKGGYLAEKVYSNIGLRVLFDIDLLFHKQDLKKVQKILEENKLRLRYLNLDFHWYLEQFLDVPMEDVWNNADLIKIGERNILSLCPEMLLIHLCIHTGLHHLFKVGGLRGLYDIKETIIYFKNKIDWDYVNVISKKWNVNECVYVALKLTDNLLGLPKNCKVKIKKVFSVNVDKELFEWAQKQLLSFHVGTYHTSKELSLYYWKIWGSYSFKEKIKAFKRLLFPPEEIIFQKYYAEPGRLKNKKNYFKRIFQHIRPYAKMTWGILAGNEISVNELKRQMEYDHFRKRLAPNGKWIHR